MRKSVLLASLILVGLCISAAQSQDEKGSTKVPAVLNFKMKGIDGKQIDLGQYKGKVVMIVNVASQCGLTPQYKGLQAIYEKYQDKGFVVIGVPANEFGMQEPGSDDEIAKFCDSKYSVKFPLLSKVVVKGNGQTPLYKYLTSKDSNPRFGGEIKWNFTKFLISRDGDIVARFEPRVDPESPEVITAIEKQLSKK